MDWKYLLKIGVWGISKETTEALLAPTEGHNEDARLTEFFYPVQLYNSNLLETRAYSGESGPSIPEQSGPHVGAKYRWSFFKIDCQLWSSEIAFFRIESPFNSIL